MIHYDCDLNWEILKYCVRYSKITYDKSFSDKDGNAYRNRIFNYNGNEIIINMCNGKIIYLKVN